MPHKQPQRSPLNNGASCCDSPVTCDPCFYNSWYGRTCNLTSYPVSLADEINGIAFDFGHIPTVDYFNTPEISIPYSETFNAHVHIFSQLGSTPYDDVGMASVTVDEVKIRARATPHWSAPFVSECVQRFSVQVSLRVTMNTTTIPASSGGPDWIVTQPVLTLNFINLYDLFGPNLSVNCAFTSVATHAFANAGPQFAVSRSVGPAFPDNGTLLLQDTAYSPFITAPPKAIHVIAGSDYVGWQLGTGSFGIRYAEPTIVGTNTIARRMEVRQSAAFALCEGSSEA